MLITNDEIDKLKSRELVPLECEICNSTFYKTKSLVMRGLKGTRSVSVCSEECRKKLIGKRQFHGYVNLQCEYCKKEFQRKRVVYNKINIKQNKIAVCSRKCASLWQHKNGLYTTNCHRSKLEKWIEQKLKLDFPNLEILFNNKTTINGELDIYIPTFELAFEINGTYHYEPIFGETVFQKRKKKDIEKIEECEFKKIELYVINTRNQRFDEKSSFKFYDFIKEKIDGRERTAGRAPCISTLVA